MQNNNNPYQILLIEDDEVDIENVKREFKKLKASIKIHIAHDGMEGLDMLQGNRGVKKLSPLPALILLDINMPKLNGIEFLKQLRADEGLQDLKVFLFTTAYTSKDKIATHSLNVAGYIVKPLTFNDVMTVYMNILGLPD